VPLQYRLAWTGRLGRAEAAVVYRFGAFTFDHDIRQLFAGKTEVHLSPKAFELVALLLANNTRALSKAELQERLWPSTFVEETNLAGLVAEIRKALGDSAANPSFVRTIYGFGYRFVAELTVETRVAQPPSPRRRPCLVLEKREIGLIEGANIIGRETGTAIHIESPGVSRHHARILVTQGDATIEDLGSKNGTHVNGTRIMQPTRLADGDQIGLAAITLTFRVESQVGATETVHSEGVGQLPSEWPPRSVF
jgi:DNA-binding winged helix-turn-helix (wHTH) protein